MKRSKAESEDFFAPGEEPETVLVDLSSEMPASAPRKVRGWWKKGQSGNPGGRPKDAAHFYFKEELKNFVPEALDQLFAKVKEGDCAAMAIYFRLLNVPISKPETARFVVPRKKGETLQDAAPRITELMLKGEISASAAMEAIGTIQATAMLTEMQSLKNMLTEWKEAQGASKP